jgi:hypothetical protein
VYGFSAKVEAGMSRELQRQLVQTHKHARQLLKIKSPETIYSFISDSTCLVYPVQAAADKMSVLDRCAGNVSEIMDLFFARDLPVRGCASFGEVVYGDNILVGPPVVRAVELEKSLPFPLVVVPLREVYPRGERRNELEDWGRYTLQQVAVRPDGRMYAYLIFPSKLDEFGRYVAENLERCLTSGPPAAAAGWRLTDRYLKTYRDDLKQRK